MSYEPKHLKYPFQWGYNGHLETVNQHDPDDLVQRVFAVLNTRLGTRMDLPQFGVRSTVLEENGPSLNVIEAALSQWAPEALASLSKKQLEDIKSQLVNVSVKVVPDAG